MKAALDYSLFSEQQLEIGKKFTRTDWQLASFFVLNFNAKNGTVHRYRPRQIAKWYTLS